MNIYFYAEPKKVFKSQGFNPFVKERVKYDKNVVDKSKFNPHQNDIADFMRSELSKSSAGTPIYDTVNGEVKNIPSQIEVALRNNRLSRAEVSEALKASEKDYQDALRDTKVKNSAAAKEAVVKARQDYLDAQTGFDPAQIQVTPTDKK